MAPTDDWLGDLRERYEALRANCACARGLGGVLRVLDEYERLKRKHQILEGDLRDCRRRLSPENRRASVI